MISWGEGRMRRGKPTHPEIKELKRKLIAIILREMEGVSTRQGERITGLRAITISRLRRGLEDDFLLDGLIGAAMNIGVTIELHVSIPVTRRDQCPDTARCAKS
jgi:hypothetical protein